MQIGEAIVQLAFGGGVTDACCSVEEVGMVEHPLRMYAFEHFESN